MNAQAQYNKVLHPSSRFLILRGLVGASRKVSKVLEYREWIQLPRWVKEKLKYQTQKLKRDNLTIQDWVEECVKENRDHQRPKGEVASSSVPDSFYGTEHRFDEK